MKNDNDEIFAKLSQSDENTKKTELLLENSQKLIELAELIAIETRHEIDDDKSKDSITLKNISYDIQEFLREEITTVSSDVRFKPFKRERNTRRNPNISREEQHPEGYIVHLNSKKLNQSLSIEIWSHVDSQRETTNYRVNDATKTYTGTNKIDVNKVIQKVDTEYYYLSLTVRDINARNFLSQIKIRMNALGSVEIISGVDIFKDHSYRLGDFFYSQADLETRLARYHQLTEGYKNIEKANTTK